MQNKIKNNTGQIVKGKSRKFSIIASLIIVLYFGYHIVSSAVQGGISGNMFGFVYSIIFFLGLIALLLSLMGRRKGIIAYFHLLVAMILAYSNILFISTLGWSALTTGFVLFIFFLGSFIVPGVPSFLSWFVYMREKQQPMRRIIGNFLGFNSILSWIILAYMVIGAGPYAIFHPITWISLSVGLFGVLFWIFSRK